MADYRYVLDPITNANSTTVIQRTADTAFIPFDPNNRDYQAYLTWLAVPNTPDPHP
jgi:hypothetical protein